ncbi:uncharacterized protein DSM5745_09740 [Aspergillus mulundensis]|uniref:Nucleoside phosphorylase domain-containing protein n=1 Tax=Aspergillus mulundensis TaxID=1810919 RepID=A0A3D8QR92_9EURO|nr:hypothetical protein DSM5745_09740 [Aspergillus mulundensis]RDW64329.1 hypothetical protein DSM5745_09740 [Aspergillus mulundensis]
MAAFRRSHRDYTVGWLCALPIETAASKAMLDRLHPPLPQPGNDHNLYTLGELHGHNVVISCLPSGVYGTTSASIVAVQMLNTFSAIRFSLLVGIGGGVPNGDTDSRLGDVVVSKPTSTYGGVVQYDYGKTVATAQMMTQCPATKRLSRPGSEFDILFDPSYRHPVSQDKTCLQCNPDRKIPRRRRTLDVPNIHYGLIASGNQVVKDDSHKIKHWQPYAAAVASAYAKELLSVIPVVQLDLFPEALTYVRGEPSTDPSEKEEKPHHRELTISDNVLTKGREIEPARRKEVLATAGISDNAHLCSECTLIQPARESN